ncbi:MAG: hypothetical protein U0835_26110 [Isosphaeraceae bacterium]
MLGLDEALDQVREELRAGLDDILTGGDLRPGPLASAVFGLLLPPPGPGPAVPEEPGPVASAEAAATSTPQASTVSTAAVPAAEPPEEQGARRGVHAPRTPRRHGRPRDHRIAGRGGLPRRVVRPATDRPPSRWRPKRRRPVG